MLFREARQLLQDESLTRPDRGPDALPAPSIDEELEAPRQRIAAPEFQVRCGAAEHQRMWQHLNRVERQLGSLLAAQLDQRGDLAGAQHCEHQDLYRHIRTLVEQQFQNLSRQYSDRTDLTRHRPNRERTAFLMSKLIRCLLDKAPASSWSVQQTLRLADAPGIEAAINRLRTDCVALTARIAKIGLAREWSHTCTAGAPLGL
ncbi:hypothetical protein Srut_39570 [Streptomyces rutgersensis]|uniref:hypothetical protein n=1 Tax=Streptomyces rutgersensis TaxID=53451 RepID=UPI0013C70331|nr:hypothetical protein [Streptomyces rutgersensis]GFH67443.1 hypothetical protein Srut_39570 [Streptomyces rutgersensis]